MIIDLKQGKIAEVKHFKSTLTAELPIDIYKRQNMNDNIFILGSLLKYQI